MGQGPRRLPESDPPPLTFRNHGGVSEKTTCAIVGGGPAGMVLGLLLARAGVAVGVAGLFMETHPDPANAMSDGPNAVPLKHMRALLEQLVALDRVVKLQPLLENDFSC